MQLKHWNRPGLANRLIASNGWPPRVTWLIAPDFALSELTSCLKRTFFDQYSRKYIKFIHQLVGHVYSLVPLVMADHSDVPESFLSSQSYEPFESVIWNFVESESSLDLVGSSQSRFTKMVESPRVIGLQARVHFESYKFQTFPIYFFG